MSQGSKVKVEPRDDVESENGINFEMSVASGKTGGTVNATVVQAETEWDYDDIVNEASKPGDISAPGLTKGSWSGDLTFLINFEDEYGKEHEHSYTETITGAACTEAGVKIFTCDCGDSYTETIPATGHDYTETIIEATCTEAGVKTFTCSCGNSYTVGIPATGHDFTDQGKCSKCGVGSQEELTDNWEYDKTSYGHTISLIKYIGNKEDITIYSQYEIDGTIYKAYICESTLGPYDSPNTSLFMNAKNVKTITFEAGLNRGYFTNMAYMFYNCENLTNIEFNDLDTSNVTNMSYMFKGCSKLTELDLSGFDTRNVTKAYTPFQDCSLLNTIYVNETKWNTNIISLSGCGTDHVTYK